MKLSEYITQEKIDDAVNSGVEAVLELIVIPFKDANVDDLKNFNAGLSAAMQSIEECDSLDQLIITLMTLQSATNIRIKAIGPNAGSSDP